MSATGKSICLLNGITVSVLGHRGEGATDSAFCQSRDAQEQRFRVPENTVNSQRQCLIQGAVGFELDAIQTQDNFIVCTHADEVSQHILIDYTPPEKYIGRMTLNQIKEIPVGVNGVGRIDLLRDSLSMVKNEFNGSIVNIELKGKIGNVEDSVESTPSLSSCVLKSVDEAEFSLENIVFSSFSLRYLREMADICANAKLGILFDGPKYHGESLFSSKEEYLDFCSSMTIESLEIAMRYIPRLFSVHPEVSDIAEETLQWIQDRNLKVYCWASQEVSPICNIAYKNKIISVLQLAAKVGMTEFCFITDHVEAMITVLRENFC